MTVLRSSAIVAVLRLGALTFAGAASAQPQPVIGSFTSTETNIDPGVSASCGFTVTETDTTIGHFEVFFDNTGAPIRAKLEENYTGFFSANGLTLNTAGAGLAIYDLN